MAELYHVLNRGVEKRSIAMDDQDRARFVYDLFEFNDAKPAGSTYYSFGNLDLRNPEMVRERQCIVDLHAWCLMGNHYHLLLSERIEGGLTLFLRKLNVGYANYFNERYRRSGTLFQGRTKKVLISRQAHFLHILHYIHLNPLDFMPSSKRWREQRVQSSAEARKHLAGYRWSSYLDYCGHNNFPSLITKEIFEDVYPLYEKEILGFLGDFDIGEIQPLVLE